MKDPLARSRSCPSCHSPGRPEGDCADAWHQPGERAAFMVVLELPPGMTPEQGQRELAACISFGRAEISFQWLLSGPAAETASDRA